MPDLVHAAVSRYLAGLAPAEDEVLAAARARSVADGVPALGPSTASLLRTIAEAVRPARVFEIGTGYGCSGLQLARALAPGGQLFTVERDAARAAVARDHFAKAGVAGSVHVMVGEAARLVHKVAGPFDLILQDGSKDQYDTTLDRLIALLRPGGVLVVDNVLWRGEIVPGFADDTTPLSGTAAAVAAFNSRLAAEARLQTTFLPVGDGVAIAVRRDDRTTEHTEP